LFIILLIMPSLAHAQPPDTDAPPPPQVAEGESNDARLEPEVRIIERGGERIEEYRLNGELFMIKIIPKMGYPYYLVDVDGDGRLETRRNDLDPDILVPRWTIFSWD
jgi:hypothetical protein